MNINTAISISFLFYLIFIYMHYCSFMCTMCMQAPAGSRSGPWISNNLRFWQFWGIWCESQSQVGVLCRRNIFLLPSHLCSSHYHLMSTFYPWLLSSTSQWPLPLSHLFYCGPISSLVLLMNIGKVSPLFSHMLKLKTWETY